MESDEKNRFVDDWLGEALRQQGAIEPRPGLESRILANLRAENHRTAQNTRWWPVLAAAAIALAIAAAIWMDTGRRRTPNLAVSHPDVPQAVRPQAHGNAPPLVAKLAGRHKARKAMPSRLEQFPSPQPLSEQEKMLATYVQQFRHEALLIAEAQTELFEREMPDQQIPKIGIPANSDQPNPSGEPQ